MAYTGHFYTTPDLVRPPGAEIEEENQLCLLETGNPSGTIECNIRPQGHFITRLLTSTGPADVLDTGPNLSNGCENEQKQTSCLSESPYKNAVDNPLRTDHFYTQLETNSVATEPVLVRRASINGVVETCSYTDRFNTIPDRVGPPGTEIAQEKVLAMNFSNSARNPLVRNLCGGPDLNREMLSTTAWPTGTAPSISGLASTSGTYPAQTLSWTALFTHSMSVLSGSGEVSAESMSVLSGCDDCSDLLIVRDCSPDDEESYIEPIVSTQSALLTRSALLTQSALHTQSKPILPGGRGKGSVSSDLTPHDDLNTGNHFITRFLGQTGITTPIDDCSQIPLVNSGEFF
jgi:hypothetical protein